MNDQGTLILDKRKLTKYGRSELLCYIANSRATILKIDPSIHSELDFDFLLTIIRHCPDSVHSLHLTMFRARSEQFITLLKSLPKTIQHLDLTANELYQHESDIDQIFAAIPGHITSINLTDNKLGRISVQTAKTLFKSLSQTVKMLDLTGNELGELNDSAADLIKSIPRSVLNLSLANNRLHSLKFDQIIILIDSIPKTVTHLDLKVNSFDQLWITDHCSLLYHLPKKIRSLDISNTGIDECYRDWQDIFSTLNRNITHLILTDYKLCLKAPNKLLDLLQALKRTAVNTIDLNTIVFQATDWPLVIESIRDTQLAWINIQGALSISLQVRQRVNEALRQNMVSMYIGWPSLFYHAANQLGQASDWKEQAQALPPVIKDEVVRYIERKGPDLEPSIGLTSRI